MSGDENPASRPTPVQDVQGDGRWMSLVSHPTHGARESGFRGCIWFAQLRALRVVRAQQARQGKAGRCGPRSARGH